MRLHFVLLVSTFLLISCAQQPTRNAAPESWEMRQVTMSEIETWEIQGKFSIRQQQEATTANLSWSQQSSEHYDIALSGPLGQGRVLLSGKPGHVTLQDARGRIDTARNAQGLLYKHTGWDLPIESLYYWVRGLPDPHYPEQHVLNAEQQIAQLKQHGWVLIFNEYQVDEGYVVPRKISLHYPETRITLLLNRWEIN